MIFPLVYPHFRNPILSGLFLITPISFRYPSSISETPAPFQKPQPHFRNPKPVSETSYRFQNPQLHFRTQFLAAFSCLTPISVRHPIQFQKPQPHFRNPTQRGLSCLAPVSETRSSRYSFRSSVHRVRSLPGNLLIHQAPLANLIAV